MTDERVRIAHHEAGHVAAAWILLGEPGIFGEASIVATLATDGHAHAGPQIGDDELLEAQRLTLLAEPIDHEFRGRIEQMVMILMAGSLAELDASERAVIEPDNAPEPDSLAARAIEARMAAAKEASEASGLSLPAGDYSDERRWVAALTVEPAEADAYRKVLLYRTRRLVRGNALFRPLVDALSAALLEQDVLSRVDLIEVIRTSTGTEPQTDTERSDLMQQPAKGSYEWRVRELIRLGLDPYGSRDVQ